MQSIFRKHNQIKQIKIHRQHIADICFQAAQISPVKQVSKRKEKELTVLLHSQCIHRFANKKLKLSPEEFKKIQEKIIAEM